MIKPLLFLIHRVFNTFSGRKDWRFGKFLLVWISFVFPEMMRNSIFDLENGGSTYTRGRLIHEVDLYTRSTYTRVNTVCINRRWKKKGKFLIEWWFNHLGRKDARGNMQITSSLNYIYFLVKREVWMQIHKRFVNDQTNLINYYNVIISEKLQADSY